MIPPQPFSPSVLLQDMKCDKSCKPFMLLIGWKQSLHGHELSYNIMYSKLLFHFTPTHTHTRTVKIPRACVHIICALCFVLLHLTMPSSCYFCTKILSNILLLLYGLYKPVLVGIKVFWNSGSTDFWLCSLSHIFAFSLVMETVIFMGLYILRNVKSSCCIVRS